MMDNIRHLIEYSANPTEGLHYLQEFQKAYQNQFGKMPSSESDKKDFYRIFGNSRFLSQFSLRHPECFESFSNLSLKKEITFEEFQIDLVQLTNQSEDDSGNNLEQLKIYKYKQYIRFTVKELIGINQIVTYREISSLAKAFIHVLFKKALKDMMTRYQVLETKLCDYSLLGMGKLGGEELNYSSDIDLIGIYRKEETWKYITSHEFYVRLFQDVGQKLSHKDANGFLYRVDWDLRPEGKSGTLANSLSSVEYYYQTFGEEWERQAFIKARPILQSNHLGDETLKMLTPFVYRRSFDEATIKRIWDMKAKIVEELNQKSETGLNIKLDHGGIRDIEFFTQGFQLLHGGLKPALRTANTINALHELKKLKIIKETEQKILEADYLFLRRLESCIHMESEQQTHVIQENKEHKLKLAAIIIFK